MFQSAISLSSATVSHGRKVRLRVQSQVNETRSIGFNYPGIHAEFNEHNEQEAERKTYIYIVCFSLFLVFGRSFFLSRLRDNSSTMLIERNLASIFQARGYERRITTGEKRYRAQENNLCSSTQLSS